MTGTNFIFYCRVEYTEIYSILRSIYVNTDTDIKTWYLETAMTLLSCETSVLTYEGMIKRVETIDISASKVTSQQLLLAEAPGTGPQQLLPSARALP